MSLQNVVGFWQRVQNDAALLDEVKDVANRDEWLRQIVRIASQNGFAFTPAEMLEAEAVLVFWKKVQSDRELQTRLKPTRLMQSEEQAAGEVVKIAGAAGFQFSQDALKLITQPYVEAYSAKAVKELNDKQLETVVGGLWSSGGSIYPKFPNPRFLPPAV